MKLVFVLLFLTICSDINGQGIIANENQIVNLYKSIYFLNLNKPLNGERRIVLDDSLDRMNERLILLLLDVLSDSSSFDYNFNSLREKTFIKIASSNESKK